MLEVFYETTTKVVTAWRSGDKQGIRPVREGETKIMLGIVPPSDDRAAGRDYIYDEGSGTLQLRPDFTSLEPSHSTHISTIDAIDTAKARPVRIKRMWQNKDYFYDCLATESVKDQYVAGDVKVGDYVIVFFDDIGEQIVTSKVYKSWV